MSDQQVRVRFAPSPTGPLHIGGVRTALYNYLFAKKHHGAFILRIEDTDQTRYVQGSEKYIIDALNWCGIFPDEGPVQGGKFQPYRQSERKKLYQKYCEELIDSGHAYYAFDTPEELDEARTEALRKSKVPFQYNYHTRTSMRNGLVLGAHEVQTLLNEGHPHVVRMKIPEDDIIEFVDEIRGEVKVNSKEMDDKIMLKSDGLPTYHLANVLDDHLMEISHVIRGEEWLPSTPFHVLLYKAFGWEDSMPRFAHLPLLLKPDGKGKLSKRDSLKHGFPIFPLEWMDPATGERMTGFRESGYLSEAFINFLSLLGWNPGTEQELFGIDDLIEAFSIDRISKAGARFDIEKAKWFNQQYIKNLPLDTLVEFLTESLEDHGIECSAEKKSEVADAMRERITFPEDIYSNGLFFFHRPTHYDEKVIKKKWSYEVEQVLHEYSSALINFNSLDIETAKGTLTGILELHEIGMGRIMPLLRIAITGGVGGPDLMQIIVILGAQESSERIELTINAVQSDTKYQL